MQTKTKPKNINTNYNNLKAEKKINLKEAIVINCCLCRPIINITN